MTGDKPLFWSLVAIVIALLINAGVAAAPECEPTPQIQSAESSQNNQDSSRSVSWIIRFSYAPACAAGSFVIRHKAVIDGLSTFIIAAFTVVLAWSTIRLWRETERLAIGGERQHAAVNRPFLFIKESRPIPIFDSLGNVVRRDVMHIWENSGNTPALRTRTHVSWRPIPTGLPTNFDYPDVGAPDLTEALVGPKGMIISDSLRIPEVIYQHVAAGTDHLFTWGWIEYDDTFENTPRHRTEFCYEVIVVVQPGGLQATISFRFHGPHNGADGGSLKPVQT